MRDRCDSYDILLFLLHERDDSRAPRRWRHNASGFVVQEDAKEVAMPRFRSLRFELEQRAVWVFLLSHVKDRREILPLVQLGVVQLGVVVVGAVALLAAVLEPCLNLVGVRKGACRVIIGNGRDFDEDLLLLAKADRWRVARHLLFVLIGVAHEEDRRMGRAERTVVERVLEIGVW